MRLKDRACLGGRCGEECDRMPKCRQGACDTPCACRSAASDLADITNLKQMNVIHCVCDPASEKETARDRLAIAGAD